MDNSNGRYLTRENDFRRLIEIVCSIYGIHSDDIYSLSRSNTVVDARQQAMFLLRKYSRLSHEAIADLMGRTHSTSINAIKCVEDRIVTVKGYQELLKRSETIIINELINNTMKSIEELNEELAEKEDQLKEINIKLVETKSDSNYRELLKTKNELVADIQTLKITLHDAMPKKPLARSLNESFEL